MITYETALQFQFQFKQFILPIAQNINNSGIYSRGEGPTEAQSPQMIRLDRLQTIESGLLVLDGPRCQLI